MALLQNSAIKNVLILFSSLSNCVFINLRYTTDKSKMTNEEMKMDELEKVEKLREKTGVTYAEAKEALVKSDGNLLDALIYLEGQGKANKPPGGGFYSGAGITDEEHHDSYKSSRHTGQGHEDFASMMKRFGRFCMMVLHKGNTNHLVAMRNGEHLFSCPVTALVILLLFFWVTLPIFIVTLSCGFRYSFSGPDLDRDSVNKVMDSASNIAEDVKKSFTDDKDKDKDNDDDNDDDYNL